MLHGEALVAIGGDEEDVWVLQVGGRLQDLVEGDVAVEADHDGAHLRVQTDVVQAAVEHVTLHDVWLRNENTCGNMTSDSGYVFVLPTWNTKDIAIKIPQ